MEGLAKLASDNKVKDFREAWESKPKNRYIGDFGRYARVQLENQEKEFGTAEEQLRALQNRPDFTQQYDEMSDQLKTLGSRSDEISGHLSRQDHLVKRMEDLESMKEALRRKNMRQGLVAGGLGLGALGAGIGLTHLANQRNQNR